MSAAVRIQKLLDTTLATPERDGAGVITPAGYEASMHAKAIRECLRIVLEEEGAVENA